jgi:hypothetical protein
MGDAPSRITAHLAAAGRAAAPENTDRPWLRLLAAVVCRRVIQQASPIGCIDL